MTFFCSSNFNQTVIKITKKRSATVNSLAAPLWPPTHRIATVRDPSTSANERVRWAVYGACPSTRANKLSLSEKFSSQVGVRRGDNHFNNNAALVARQK